MKLLLRRIKPASGFAHFLHIGLVLVLPIAVFILVRSHFVQLALSIIVLSKWRMFAVRPRFWAANVRANAVDLMVGLSVVLFMTHASGALWQLLYGVLYTVWLLAIKPASGLLMTSVQALIGQLCALTALYLVWSAGPVYGITFITGLICFLAARHFFDGFDEPYAKLLSYSWGYFGAALAWLLSHLLIAYLRTDSGLLSQPVIFLTLLGYGVGVLYYLEHFDRLSRLVRRQTVSIIVFATLALVVSLYMRTRHLIT